MGLSSRAGVIVGAMAIGAALVSSTAGAVTTATAAPFCELSGVATHTWDGGGDGSSWSDPLNWSGDVAPGVHDQDDAYVCLGEAQVTMAAGDVALVQAFDMDNPAQLIIQPGAGLFVYGDLATRPSTLRGYLEVNGAYGGPGLTHLMGLFGTSARSSEDVLDPAPALTSNPCDVFGDLPASACTSEEGRLVGHNSVIGYGGLRLLSGYDLTIYGSFVPADAGIGMSSGSRLELLPDAGKGALNIHGGADFYPLDGGSPRPVVVNEGIIRHYGSGPVPSRRITVISTRYTGDGQIWVEDKGEVLIADGSVRPAEVTAGSLLGSGSCLRAGDNCELTTLPAGGKRQSAVLRAPVSQPDAQRALVQVRPRPDLRKRGDLGVPYLMHADDLQATAATPAVIELRYDGSLLGGRTWADVQVFRQGKVGGWWRRVRTCRADGTPPGSNRVCVDRSGSSTSSRQVPGSGGDAILVVRTTVTSRWVGR